MDSNNVVRITPYSVEYSLDCGENGEMERFLRCFDDAGAMFYFVSKMYAFSDCCGEMRIHCILMDGRECRYAGWQPGMRYEFYDCETKETVYDSCFQEWDH